MRVQVRHHRTEAGLPTQQPWTAVGEDRGSAHTKEMRVTHFVHCVGRACQFIRCLAGANRLDHENCAELCRTAQTSPKYTTPVLPKTCAVCGMPLSAHSLLGRS
jgi:hypothetical protein